VSILRDLVVPPGAEPVSAHAWDVALQQVHSVLDSIDWSATNTEQTRMVQQGDSVDAAADEEYERERPFRFGPTSAQDRDRLAAASEARRQSLRDMSDDDLFDQLFRPES
jgi:hypothetical protein